MGSVTVYMKSRQVIYFESANEDAHEETLEYMTAALVDPAVRVIHVPDEGNTTIIPIDNIDWVQFRV